VVVVVVVVVVASYPLFSPNPLSTWKLKANTEIKSRQIRVELNGTISSPV
jgi:hypothetical protein